MKILDLSAGNRAVWFNKRHPDAVYLDIRPEVKPDVICDSRCIPDLLNGFDLLVFDPPHTNYGPNSNMSRVYGYFKTKEILDTIEKTAIEAHRVSNTEAILILKWNDHDIKLERVLKLMPQWEPLFGHLTKDGPGSKTYWVTMRRNP